MNSLTSFTELHVWKIAHALRLDIYKLTRYLPKNETFNVISQIKRSAHSVGSNIAEGFGRYHFQENIQFCRQARGSLEETKDHLLFIRDVPLIPKEHLSQCNSLIQTCDELKAVLNSYIFYLNKQKCGNSNNSMTE